MNSFNNSVSTSYNSITWSFSFNAIDKISNYIKEELREKKKEENSFTNILGEQNYLDEVDCVVEEYRNNIQEGYNDISALSLENIKKFIKLLYKNNITNYDIIPSSLGDIYCEWRNSETSMGIAFNNNKLSFEYVTHKKNRAKEFVQITIDSNKDFPEILSKLKEKLDAERF